MTRIISRRPAAISQTRWPATTSQTRRYASQQSSTDDTTQQDQARLQLERFGKFRESNPILADYLENGDQGQTRDGKDAPNDPTKGPRLSSSSLFSAPAVTAVERHAPQWFPVPPGRNPISMATKLDPQPTKRRAWERKMVIMEVRKRGRISKEERIRRTERALTARSDFLRTSIKKLQPLANQIAGKSIEDAIVQMRFSKKGAAVEVKRHLEEARLKAIVERGMGLGKVQEAAGSKTVIRLKDGTRHKIDDRTGIYIDQSWVGRGSYASSRSPRAKGTSHVLRHPQTSISVLLKEEKTRIREYGERQEKWRNRKVWTPLPDRPVTAQRQQYCW
ncbi:MAG: 54S ribosomal protein L22, mitochondrial [Chrysothrix sp. TS-e1954]|nr:MAG: 54S ribosomal protein L22, mitochondrial [Chrysothrix sp. TS-e1954]